MLPMSAYILLSFREQLLSLSHLVYIHALLQKNLNFTNQRHHV
jgi:hypothetical protein